MNIHKSSQSCKIHISFPGWIQTASISLGWRAAFRMFASYLGIKTISTRTFTVQKEHDKPIKNGQEELNIYVCKENTQWPNWYMYQ